MRKTRAFSDLIDQIDALGFCFNALFGKCFGRFYTLVSALPLYDRAGNSEGACEERNLTDVLIIGAGVAGLSAALDLKKRGVSCLVIEATDKPGGRARTRRTASGTMIDLGAHWLHGEDTPLRGLLDHYGLPYHQETEGEMFLQIRGKLTRSEEDWIETVIDWDKANAIKARTVPDVPLPDLGVDDAARERLSSFGLMWDGIDPPYHPSAYEFLTDENTRGGLQPKNGMGSIVDALARDLGVENLRLNAPVYRRCLTKGPCRRPLQPTARASWAESACSPGLWAC